MKKKLLALALCASMLVGVTACGKSASSKSASATKLNTDKDTLYINLASEPDYLDPALNSSVDGACLAVNSFVGLYTYNKDSKLTPALAKDMPEVSSDGLTYTVKMNKSKWSNGDELTANDFVYSWNRAINEKTAADYSYLFDVVARKADGTLDVTATDDYTLVIKLTAPCPYFNQLLAFPVFDPVYQAGVEKADPNGTNPGAWAQDAGFVCNGAYTLKSWKHKESMVYVQNPNYYDAKNVTMKKLNFMLSADDTATYAAYNSGDLDFVDTVPNDEIANVKSSKEFHIADNLGTYYLAFNVNSDLFKGLTPKQASEFREAISLMIDRKYIVQTVGQTGQKVADAFIPNTMSDGNGSKFNTNYYDASKTGTDNAKKAMKLLKDCGYKFTDKGDGTYSCEPAISIPYILNDDSGHQKVAECIQQDLATIGVELTISTEDWNVFLEDRKDGNFTFAREGWIADYDDPINMLEMFTSDSGNNDPQLGKATSTAAPDWSQYDTLIKQIRTTTDTKNRVDLMKQAEKMLMDTWAVVPIYYYNDIYMQKTNVSGIYTTVFGNKYFMYATKTAK